MNSHNSRQYGSLLDHNPYDYNLGLDDVDGINALLSTGDVQLDMEELDAAFKMNHDPMQVCALIKQIQHVNS
jgi:hypothetical protein